MVDGKAIFVSKTLKKVEAILNEDKNFFRSHNSYIINLKYIHRYLKGEGGEVVLHGPDRIRMRLRSCARAATIVS